MDHLIFLSRYDDTILPGKGYVHMAGALYENMGVLHTDGHSPYMQANIWILHKSLLYVV